jgi:hypothetical protein
MSYRKHPPESPFWVYLIAAVVIAGFICLALVSR